MNNIDADWPDRDTEFTEDDAEESSHDLKLSEVKFSDLLIAPADWTIETLYSQIGKQIDLDPEFQRRNVWNSKSKSRFIESLILGIPIPQILLSSKPGSKSSFLVLDGKQRLLTIKEFIDGELPNRSTFRLKDLRVLKDLEGKSWSEIKNDPEMSSKLLNETQRTAVLRGWTDESVLYEIFYRLNSGSVKLSPMELRMSLYPGEFLKYVLKWSERIGPLHRLLKKKAPDPRMGDVELAVRFLAFDDPVSTYRGDLKFFLDEVCQRYNTDFHDQVFSTQVAMRLLELDRAIETGLFIFEDNFCRKFIKGTYEKRFNRALFDIMALSLADHRFRIWANDNRDNLVKGFEELCTNDTEFVRAIESTTKSVEATRIRFDKWLSLCRSLSGISVNPPLIG